MNLYSYVVTHDSGFAPNPFYGYCTLCTCKPGIRKTAKIDDWIIGSGSANKFIEQGGLLVYAMQVSETLTFDEYFVDQRFQTKKPNLCGSRKQARGDNIYSRVDGEWHQLNSYHSHTNGDPNSKHVTRDTKVNRILISQNFIYFGKNGPTLPKFTGRDDRPLCHRGRNYSKFSDANPENRVLICNFAKWFETLGDLGYISPPFDWSDNQ